MIRKALFLAAAALAMSTPLCELNGRGEGPSQASLRPLESRILDLRMGTVINSTIMNGTSFVVALA
jgi:hypothetical protein